MKRVDQATSRGMSKIKGRDTSPEKYVRNFFHKQGFRLDSTKKTFLDT
tara:strand:- start:177 stop:320 length:144 start_codon:yes stop_codon:yes gene_type:complete